MQGAGGQVAVAQLVVHLAGAQAGRAAVEQRQRDIVLVLVRQAADDQGEIHDGRVRDIVLAAIEHVTAVRGAQGALDAAHVRARAGFGDAGGADVAAQDGAEIAVALPFAAVPRQAPHHAGLGDDRQQQFRRADGGGQAVEGGRETPPVARRVVAAGHDHAPQAGVAQALPAVKIETFCARGGAGGNVAADAGIALAYLALLRCKHHGRPCSSV